MNNIQEYYCCDEGLTPGYGGGCLKNKENYLIERRGGGGGGGHGSGAHHGGGRGGYGGGNYWGAGGGWGYYYDDGLYYDNCPKDYHYDPNNYGCVKDVDTCPTGSHYHPEHPKADLKGCMKDEDMIEKYTKSYSLIDKNSGSNFLIFTGVFILIILILYLIYRKL
jgi:hypothetical protein